MKQPVVIDRDTLAALIDCAEDIARVDAACGDEDAASLAEELASKGRAALSNSFIAVSERLPEDEEMKIDLLLGDGSILAGSRHDGGCAFQHRIGYFYSKPIISGSNDPLVTHWRATEVV